VMNADGSNKTLLHKGRVKDLAWSPDGTKILFSLTSPDGPLELWVLDMQSDKAQYLVVGEMGAWSPDGEQIAFVQRADEGRSDLYVMNSDGSNVECLTDTAQLGEIGPPWTPDGVLTTLKLDVMSATWSPDGTLIAFSARPNASDDNVQIFTVEVDTKSVSQLTSGPRNSQAPVWSPDGTRILFESDRDGPKEWVSYDLYVMKRDGTEQMKLTSNAQSEPSTVPQEPQGTIEHWSRGGIWSPNGEHIIYTSGFKAGVAKTYFRLDVWKMTADGQEHLQLTDTEDAWPTGWSQDGSQILYLRTGGYPGYYSDIWMMNDDGGDKRKLVDGTTTGSKPSDPVWQPFWIPHIEVTQAIHNEENGLPLVAGKRILVRVYVDCGAGCGKLEGVTGVLEVSSPAAGISLPPDNGPITAEHPENGWTSQRGELDKTLNFTVPANLANGDVTFKAIVNGASRSETLTFHPRESLHIVVVPVRKDGKEPPTWEEMKEYQSLLAQTFPTANVRYELGESGPLEWGYTTPCYIDCLKNCINPLRWNDCGVECEASCFIREKLFHRLRHEIMLDNNPTKYQFVFGWLPEDTWDGPQYSLKDSHGGFAEIGRKKSRQHIFAHEVGHLLGLDHAPNDDTGGKPDERTGLTCSKIDQIDDKYPADYPFLGSIGDFGFNGSEIYGPDNTADFMTYCGPRVWISEYHWRRLFGKIGPPPQTPPSTPAPSRPTPTPTPPTPTPTPTPSGAGLIVDGWRVIPVTTIAKGTEFAGRQQIVVHLAFENLGGGAQTPSKAWCAKGCTDGQFKLVTSEGYVYDAWARSTSMKPGANPLFPVGYDLAWSGNIPVPPGIMYQGFRVPMGFLHVFGLSASPAVGTSGYQIQTPFGLLDATPVDVKFPTSRPDTDFLNPGDSFTIGDVKVTAISITRPYPTSVSVLWQFENPHPGYGRKVSFNIASLGSKGIIDYDMYGGGARLGPGQTGEGEDLLRVFGDESNIKIILWNFKYEAEGQPVASSLGPESFVVFNVPDGDTSVPVILPTPSPSSSTDESGIAPAPRITSVQTIPDQVIPGQPFRVRIEATNEGGPTVDGYINVSSPDNATLEIVSHSASGDSDDSYVTEPGDNLYHYPDGGLTKAAYQIAEVRIRNWPKGATQHIEVKVTPREGHQATTVYARVSLSGKTLEDIYIEPTNSSIVDQQGFPVFSYQYP